MPNFIKPTFHKPEIHDKSWGREIWITNNHQYCGKILEFNDGAEFSTHYHLKKTETWYVLEGCLELKYYNLMNAEPISRVCMVGEVIHIEPGIPHKLKAIGQSKIIEVSTQHFENDSYRILPGDSQK